MYLVEEYYPLFFLALHLNPEAWDGRATAAGDTAPSDSGTVSTGVVNNSDCEVEDNPPSDCKAKGGAGAELGFPMVMYVGLHLVYPPELGWYGHLSYFLMLYPF